MNRILKGILRRLYYGVKISFKFLLLCPILVFMVLFSYTVDRSGLFQGALGPRTVVDLMLDGKDVTNFEQMDERSVVSLYAQDVPEESAPSVIGIGSSRILQFNHNVMDTDSYFCMGVTGADVRDNMTSYYVMVREGKTPDVLVWSVDPWVLYGSEKAFDSRADSELYNEFLTKVLGVQTDYEEPDKVELWKALADPAYFQGNMDYYVSIRSGAAATDDEGNEIPFKAVTGDVYDNDASIKRSDGSVLYSKEFREQNQDQILFNAMSACNTFSSIHMEGFTELSAKQEEAFDAFIRYAQSNGTTVILVLCPWHPYLYDFLLWQEADHQGFLQVENWIRQYAHDNQIPLYGSYDPLLLGMEEMDFFDGLHCKDTGIQKFFPGVPAVLEQIRSDSLPDPLAVQPRTTSAERCPW